MTPYDKMSINRRNPDFCSVFRSELIAINEGLEAVLSMKDYGELWILSDSRSSLQHLHKWFLIGDLTSISILNKLKQISQHHEIHLQWIPSHVDIHGNELADKLAREGCNQPIPTSSTLTFQELYSRKKEQIMADWRVPPTHHWYMGRKPGIALALDCDRSSSTALTRLASGHIKCLSFFEGSKRYDSCSKCGVHEASPRHILDCLGLSREDIYATPLLVLDFLRVNGILDLV